VVQVGQQLRVKVLQADETRRRISLSLKQVEESPEPADREPEPVGADYGEAAVVAEREPEREPAYAEVSASPQG
jgi:ribosomal protein S1